jgi:chromosome segregation protein
MFLEKLEIQGFKSFAKKNVLVFPGMLSRDKRGITAVVGPNGSGKSNVADSVRWALGEQSMKTLRGKKAEDIIFSGSDKKGKLGMSEVSLFLNNEDKRADVDYSQVVITRRLYRSGDSEYMINNSRVRLSDVQMLLARAKFGQKTYSVIGQGMVEGFLNTTLAERKEFFDEATGVKQYQIKRDDSLNKLKASYENLIQAQMLMTEIEPRLRSLTRQVNRLKKRDEIEKELKELQLVYYSQEWHEINKGFSRYNNEFLELEKDKFARDKKLAHLTRELENLENESGKENEFINLQNELNKKQEEKEEINKKLALLEARTEVKLEANGQLDLSFLVNKRSELEKEIKQIEEEIISLEKNIGYDMAAGEEKEKEKEKIDKKINDINEEIKNMGDMRDRKEIEKINDKLKDIYIKLESLDQEESAEKLQAKLKEVKNEIKEVLDRIKKERQDSVKHEEKEWQEKQDLLNKLLQDKENIITKINEDNLRISARTERVRLLKEKKNEIKSELEKIEDKLKQKSDKFDVAEVTREQSELKERQEKIEEEIRKAREKINEATSREDQEKNKLFALQRDMQALQNELNLINNKLNEIKINSTRYETKLEDLEIEIRREYGSLREVKEYKVSAQGGSALGGNQAEMQEKIAQLDRQLALIGGIDPEIEKEYVDTKERFDFLEGQVNDFTSTVDSLEKIIKELDFTIRERFDKEFKIIAGKFEKYFKILFNGGTAKIIKVMEKAMEEESSSSDQPADSEDEEGVGVTNESPAQERSSSKQEVADIKKIKFLQKHNATGLAGIEIQATPPGKKIKSISMLSGGERALTAIALICAIISANPSPFVVLDEVDAALDEANSERLAKILDELSHKTQFIIITHNRASMRKANILYGVTMGDDGVSKLLSIKLDEAKNIKNK